MEHKTTEQLLEIAELEPAAILTRRERLERWAELLGLPDLAYPFHGRNILVTACGRICLHRKKINISTVLAGQRLAIKEVDDGIWLVSFMHYDRKRLVRATAVAA